MALMAKVVWGDGTAPAEDGGNTSDATGVGQLGPEDPGTPTPARLVPASGTRVALMAKASPPPGAGYVPKRPALAPTGGVPSRGAEPLRRGRGGWKALVSPTGPVYAPPQAMGPER